MGILRELGATGYGWSRCTHSNDILKVLLAGLIPKLT